MIPRVTCYTSVVRLVDEDRGKALKGFCSCIEQTQATNCACYQLVSPPTATAIVLGVENSLGKHFAI